MRRASWLRLALALAAGLAFASAAASARAGAADVLAVDVSCRPAPGGRPASVCQFSVTVRHADTGWDHYANAFEVVAPDGSVIATRILQHPHVEEQPFRRSLPRVRIPHTTQRVTLRARDLVHGLGGETVSVEIPHASASPPEAPGTPSKESGK